MEPVSIYIHIPFCSQRCGYCDFNTYAGLELLIPSYAQAVCNEIAYLSSASTEQLTISTIYFGGGTPSLLPSQEIQKIIYSLRNHFHMESQIEISLEANPGSIDMSYLQELRSFGVNRLSIGMQTPNQEELALLERQHTNDDVINAVEWARTAGINNLNLDLIYGLPNQGCEAWMANLETALSLKPDHLSLYALTIEPGTPLYHKMKAEIFLELDQDITADMYEAASDRLAESGYFQYEISNWTRKNKNGELYICRHNMQYWHNLAYIGLGAGAHGYINHQRTINIYSPREYIRRLNSVSTLSHAVHSFPCTPATDQINLIDLDTEIGETMMVGLRLVTEGVSNEMFQRRFGISLQEKFGAQIDRMIKLGLLEWGGTDQKLLRLSKRGRILGNQVFMEFI